MSCCYTVYQSVYIILHKKLRLYWPRPWSHAFVINNVSGIAIEPKEFILSQLKKFKTMFLPWAVFTRQDQLEISSTKIRRIVAQLESIYIL